MLAPWPLAKHALAGGQRFERRYEGVRCGFRVSGRTIADERDVQVGIESCDLIFDHRARCRFVESARASTDDGHGHRVYVVRDRDINCVSHAVANARFAGASEQVDARDVDDPPKRKSSCRGPDRGAQRHWTVASQLAERSSPGSTRDRPGNALRQQKPPGDDVSVPRVDDRFDALIEQVPMDSREVHADGGANGMPRGVPVQAQSRARVAVTCRRTLDRSGARMSFVLVERRDESAWVGWQRASGLTIALAAVAIPNAYLHVSGVPGIGMLTLAGLLLAPANGLVSISVLLPVPADTGNAVWFLWATWRDDGLWGS